MSIILSAARTKVSRLLDDVDIIDAAVADLEDALKVGHHAVYLQAGVWAPQRFTVEGSVSTDANGVADLTALAPVRIIAVNHFSSFSRLPIPATSFSDGPTNVPGVRTLKIAYLPKLSFPASDSAAFEWGQAAIDIPLLDDLMCLHAASHVSIFLDRTNKQLERRLEVMEEKVKNIMNLSAWRVMPLRGTSGDSGLAYVMTGAVSLQLVRI